MEEKTANKILNSFLTPASVKPGTANLVKSDFHNTTWLVVDLFYKRISIQPLSAEKEKKCRPITKQKKIVPLLIILFSVIHLFSQNIHTNKVSNKESRLKHLDSLVDLYETRGIEFYHHSKYDSAIKKFSKAEHIIDSLSVMREKMADYENSIVTSCNIAIAYYKLHKSGLGLREIPEIDHVKLWDLTGNNDLFGKSMDELLAFTQFTEGDCYRGLNLQKTLYYYLIAYGNLKSTHYYSDSTTLSYKYALKSYLYKDSYRESLQSFNNGHDSAGMDMRLYLNSLKNISEDK